jgi:hypothetical protein
MAQSLNALAVGALVKDTGTLYNGKPIIWKIADKGHTGYPSGAVTLITERIISLKCFDAIESGNSDGNRRSYGNNRWTLSNVRQWLNSQAAGGTAPSTARTRPRRMRTYGATTTNTTRKRAFLRASPRTSLRPC